MNNIDTATAGYTNAEKSIADWLEQKRATLWGGQWTVTEPAGREMAAAWFRQQMEEWVQWTDKEEAGE